MLDKLIHAFEDSLLVIGRDYDDDYRAVMCGGIELIKSYCCLAKIAIHDELKVVSLLHQLVKLHCENSCEGEGTPCECWRPDIARLTPDELNKLYAEVACIE